MEELLAILVVILVCLPLKVREEREDIPKDEKKAMLENNITIYTDKETGVEYFVFNGFKQGGMCPRYNQDGTLYISETYGGK